MATFPPVPPEVKGIAHYLKVAEEHESRNIVVSYWARMHACQVIMKIVPGKKPPEVAQLLMALLDWLEETKLKHKDDTEGIGDETTANALIEQYALQLFTYADSQDRESIFNKNTVKAFYTAGILMDILEQFGELNEDIFNKRKYAKWKAAYIHNCLKVGDIPLPGGPDEQLNVVEKDQEVIEGGESDEVITSSINKPAEPQLPLSPMPQVPAPAPSPITPEPSAASTTPTSVSSASNTIGPEIIQKAQKYSKYATSALAYDDVPTAIQNLQKALNLLQAGTEN